MSKKRRRLHTKGFKEEALKRIKEQGYPVAKTANNLGVSPSCWVDRNGSLKKDGILKKLPKKTVHFYPTMSDILVRN